MVRGKIRRAVNMIPADRATTALSLSILRISLGFFAKQTQFPDAARDLWL